MAPTKWQLRQQVKRAVSALTGDQIGRQSDSVFEQLRRLPQYQRSRRIGVYLSTKHELQTDAIVQDILSSGKECYVPRYREDSAHMDMVRVTSWRQVQSLPLTRWHIRQPPHDDGAACVAGHGSLQLLLLPGVAFSRQPMAPCDGGSSCGDGDGAAGGDDCVSGGGGNGGGDSAVAHVWRLGRGGGYYDAYLRRCRAYGKDGGADAADVAAAEAPPPLYTVGLALSVQVFDQVPVDRRHDQPIDALLSPA